MRGGRSSGLGIWGEEEVRDYGYDGRKKFGTKDIFRRKKFGTRDMRGERSSGPGIWGEKEVRDQGDKGRKKFETWDMRGGRSSGLGIWGEEEVRDQGYEGRNGKELFGLSTNFHIHVSVSDLYIPTMDLPILLQEVDWSWEYINGSEKHDCRNWDWDMQIFFWEYINGIFVAVCTVSSCLYGPLPTST
jgi:hypothetical protein